MSRSIVVVDGYALNPGDLTWSAIEALGELTVHDRTPADQIASRSARAEAVLTNKVPYRREILAELKKLRYIGVLATGYDIVDVAAAREHGIAVTNIPTYGTNSVAQFAFAQQHKDDEHKHEERHRRKLQQRTHRRRNGPNAPGLLPFDNDRHRFSLGSRRVRHGLRYGT